MGTKKLKQEITPEKNRSLKFVFDAKGNKLIPDPKVEENRISSRMLCATGITGSNTQKRQSQQVEIIKERKDAAQSKVTRVRDLLSQAEYIHFSVHLTESRQLVARETRKKLSV